MTNLAAIMIVFLINILNMYSRSVLIKRLTLQINQCLQTGLYLT